MPAKLACRYRLAAAWGWIGGINTPLSVVCSTRTSLCYQARVWGTKVAIADVPKPKCTKTRNGVVCLYPKRSLDKTRTQNRMARSLSIS